MSNRDNIARTIRWNLTSTITDAQAQAVARVLDVEGYQNLDDGAHQRELAAAWASGYWHGASHDGPLSDATVDALNPYTDAA